MIKRHWPWIRTIGILGIGFCAFALLAYRFLFPVWLEKQWSGLQVQLDKQGIELNIENPRLRPFWFSWRAEHVRLKKGDSVLSIHRPRVNLGLDVRPWRWRVRLDATVSGLFKKGPPLPLKADLTGPVGLAEWAQVEGVIYTEGKVDFDALKGLLSAQNEPRDLQKTSWWSTLHGHAFIQAWASVGQASLTAVDLHYRHVRVDDTLDVAKKNRWGLLGGQGQIAWKKEMPDRIQFRGFTPRFMLKTMGMSMPWNSALHYDGQVAWGKGDSPLTVMLNELRWDRTSEEGRVRLLWQSAVQGESAFLAATIHSPRVWGQTLSESIPEHAVSDDLKVWLKGAFSKGSADDVEGFFRGTFHDFPFDPLLDKPTGRFGIVFHPKRLQLHYAAGWPDLENLNGTVWMLDRTLSGDIVSGEILGAEIQKASFVIPTMRADQPAILELDAEVNGQVADALRYVSNSPLKASFGRMLGGHGDWSGPTALKLHIHKPLEEKYPLEASGEYQLNGVSISTAGLTLKDLKGTINFKNDRIESKDGLTGLLGDRPWQFQLSSSTKEMTLEAKGLYPYGFQNRVKGDGLTQVRVHLPFSTEPTHWTLHSDLLGVVVQDIPLLSALQKKEQEVRNFDLEGQMPSSSEVAWPFSGQYGREVRFKGAWDPKADGKLDHLGVVFRNDTLSGRIVFPMQKTDPYQVDLDRWVIPASALDLSKSSQKAGVAKTGTTATTPSELAHWSIAPEEIPALSFRAKDVHYGTRWKGEISFAVKPDPQQHRLLIEALHVAGDALALNASGFWEQARPAQNTTHLKGAFSSPNWGHALHAWGWHSSLAEAAGELSFETTWPQDPMSPAWDSMVGMLSVDLGKGRLLDVDPGVGRVVGLLNLEGLTRRLRLDFSDFYKKGFSFDKVHGTFDLQGGQLKTSDLVIKGTSAKISITGRTGLVARDYDLNAEVEPQVSGTLPLAAAVAVGNPAVGAVVWVADRLLNQQVNAFSSRRYHITGKWDDPEMESVQTGKKEAH